MTAARSVLSAPDLPQRVRRLGFRGPDVADALAAAAAATASAADLRRIEVLAGRLVGAIGAFTGAPHQPGDEATESPWAGEGSGAEQLAPDVLALLAFLVSADAVAGYHNSRGVAAEISERSLSELGQQAWVHRQTFGSFGLHTYDWLRITWSGALYWLGRLQFNLQAADGAQTPGRRWVLSCHIPRTGPLTPESVDRSLTAAAVFFAEHFSDYPVTEVVCGSWLLDPALAAALPVDSNIASFQRRWERYGEPMPADADVLFFTFSRRGSVDLDTLSRDTTLQRAIVDRLKAGQHWSFWNGRLATPVTGATL